MTFHLKVTITFKVILDLDAITKNVVWVCVCMGNLYKKKQT